MSGNEGDSQAREELRTASIGDAPTGSLLDRPGGGEPHPERIGPYIIRELIGEGGFGYVYAADQVEPVKRRVALKVIKPGMDSKAVIARFEAERQALAVMDHPGVAKVFDGGTVPDGQPGAGRPYFVMEYVKGEPITTFCDRHRLTIDERIALMIQVCEAVQHAHTKAVIHRDIKPSNILVGYVDDKPTAKVIDFGVAKSLNQRLSEATIFTERGQMIGTPEYMSPEQAEMSGVDIDTRSDVYSLGVVLYELLTGTRPFDLRKLALNEMVRVIRETPPPLPSSRYGRPRGTGRSTGDQIGGLDRSRGLPNRDLDWICMKCLQKARSARYESARDLARDLWASTHGQATTVSGPTLIDRADRLYRRHKAGLRAGLLVVSLAFVLFGALLFDARRRTFHDYAATSMGTLIALLAVPEVYIKEQFPKDLDPYWESEAIRQARNKLFGGAGENTLSMTDLVKRQMKPGEESLFRTQLFRIGLTAHTHSVLAAVFVVVSGAYGVFSIAGARRGRHGLLGRVLAVATGTLLFAIFFYLVPAEMRWQSTRVEGSLLMSRDRAMNPIVLGLALALPVIATLARGERLAMSWRSGLGLFGYYLLSLSAGAIIAAGVFLVSGNPAQPVGVAGAFLTTDDIVEAASDRASDIFAGLSEVIRAERERNASGSGGP